MRRAKRLKENGFTNVYTGTQKRTKTYKSGRTKTKFRKLSGGKWGNFEIEDESFEIFDKNLNAYMRTFSSENFKHVMEMHAETIIVPAVRGKLPKTHRTKRPNPRGYYWGGRRVFDLLEGNLEKSYQVLNRKRYKNVVFVGPKAYFKAKKAYAKVYGRSTSNTNAFYAPAFESRNPTIKPALRAIAPTYLNANARVIRTMMKP